ncbi:MAG TPA: DUF5985 family protein [Xanthomonadales bacterium]|nr:DUF5985 family protein [Xanthomonadales bacterium]
MNEILLGAISLASFAIGLFFLKFWLRSRDRFFLLFALAFLIEAVDRFALGATGALREEAPAYYLVRVIAYGMILFAIFDKNRAVTKPKD